MALGMGMTFVPLTLVATAGVDAEEGGLASGLFNTSQQVGGALGLAILATFAANRTSGVLEGFSGAPSALQSATALVEGFQTAFIVAAGLMVFGLFVVTFFLRKEEVAHVHLEADVVDAVPVPA
jgi:hypothetical protein